MARIRFSKVENSDTPTQGQITVFARPDNNLWLKDDQGNEVTFLTSANIVAPKVEYHILTEQEVSQKELLLDQIPSHPERTVADVFNGGGPMRPQADFNLFGRIFSWENGRFDALLTIGDEIRIVYY